MCHAQAYGESRYVDVIADGTVRAQLRLPPAVHAALTALRTWVARRCQRDILRELDPHILRDIGVSPELARREPRKPFWQEYYW
jgi:uncharacterized protein YjiS (DUF1127 family)